MNKSRIFWLVINLLAYGIAFSCYVPIFDNCDLRIYRALDPEQSKTILHPNSQRQDNLQLWYDAVQGKCAMRDIEKVVYKYTLDSIRSVNDNSDNAFARLLTKQENAPIYDFLLVAKEVETLRQQMSDPWYYALPDDYQHLRLDTLLQQCKRHMDTPLAPRYCVQALRIMMELRNPDSIVAFWDKHQAKLPDNILRQMSQEYVAGAYYQLGEMDKAFETYMPLLHSTTNGASGYLEEMQTVYKYDPNHYLLRENAQSIINQLEDRIKYEGRYRGANRVGRSDSMASDSVYLQLCDFALAAARNPRVKYPGFWHYTAAYLYYLNDDDAHARQQASLAGSCHLSPYDRESLRALRLLLDLENGHIDRNRLCSDLQWIEANMRAELDTITDPEISSWCLYNGYQVSPWTDIMRKICSIGAPKLISCGNVTLGLQLGNYGYFMPYRMMDGNIKMAYDYDNDSFRQMDSIMAKQAADFAMRINHPQDALDRLLIKGGRFDTDYIYDHVGTLYLRERNYAEAVKWLRKVSSAYQTTMNVNEYMKLDPFRWLDCDHLICDNSDYKLCFAQEMLSLEQTMQQSADPDRRANAKIRYAIGLRNSFGRCWALCYYYFDGFPDCKEDKSYDLPRYSEARSAFQDYPAANEAYDICDKLIAEALDEFSCDELKANALLSMKNFKTVVKQMPDTQAAEYVRAHCDKYIDYALHLR